jgi:tetratricopeptide (TPR) repeat protein
MARSLTLALIAVIGCSVFGGCDEIGARRDIQDGNKAYYSGDYDEAIRKFEAGLAAKPELKEGWFNLGLSHMAMFSPGLKTPENAKHAEGAIRAFQEYLKREPDDIQARDYLLSTYIDSGRYEGALEYFRQKLASSGGKDLEALAQLAQISTQAGRFDEAIDWHKKKADVETSKDGKADAWYSIGVLQWRRLNNHPEVMGPQRVALADSGLSALGQAEQIRKDHAATISYQNLLYRERALAHGASYARAVDVASAQIFYKRAVELSKAQAAAPGAPKPGAPKPPQK